MQLLHLGWASDRGHSGADNQVRAMLMSWRERKVANMWAAQHRWGAGFRRGREYVSKLLSRLKAGQRLLVRFKLLTTGMRALANVYSAPTTD